MISKYFKAAYSLVLYLLRHNTGMKPEPPLPPAVSVEISSRCNLSCPECLTGRGELRRQNSFMDVSLAEKISSELSASAISAWIYFQGEPMLHPQFYKMVSLFKKMNPVISTNGHFLSDARCEGLARSGLRKIIVSLDADSEKVYLGYRRGGDINMVKEGITRLAGALSKAGSSTALEIQFLAGRHNEMEAGAVASFAKSVGAGFRIKTMQVLDRSRVKDWIPDTPRMSRYVLTEGGYRLKNRTNRGCRRMWTGTVITSDGDVVPCCFDKQADYSMGNLHESSFREIWYGEKYRSFREMVMESRKNISICSECPEGGRIFFKKIR